MTNREILMKNNLAFKHNQVIIIYWLILIILFSFEVITLPIIGIDAKIRTFLFYSRTITYLWFISLPYLGIVWAINEKQNYEKAKRKNAIYTIINILFLVLTYVVNILNVQFNKY